MPAIGEPATEARGVGGKLFGSCIRGFEAISGRVFFSAVSSATTIGRIGGGSSKVVAVFRVGILGIFVGPSAEYVGLFADLSVVFANCSVFFEWLGILSI